jgi:hypothetical protein
MDPTTTPTPLASAMSHGGTFMRPGAVGWGSQPGPLPAELPPAMIEQALAAAAKDPDRVTDLLDELSRGRLWLPLPEDERPVTDGSAVVLPTVTYLGAEFVPAFTSVPELVAWHSRSRDAGLAAACPGPTAAAAEPDAGDLAGLQSPDGPFAAMPHIVVPAAELARLLPGGMGIALNPGAETSVPIYPEGVGYLAAAWASADGAQVRVGRPPSEPVTLLAEMRVVLDAIPDVQQAARAWLSVAGEGEGLIISVMLRDPDSEAAHVEVLGAIERAVRAVPAPGFPIDVTFPGEGDPDELEGWIAAQAEPFYIRP